MTKEYNPTDKIRCPQCAVIQDDTAEDYVIPGKVGGASRADDQQCHACDGWFGAIRLEDGKIEIEERDDPEE